MEQQEQQRYGGTASSMTSQGIGLLQGMHAAEPQEQYYRSPQAADYVDPNELLHAFMAQQQQAFAPPGMQQQPLEHYITIANNGM